MNTGTMARRGALWVALLCALASGVAQAQQDKPITERPVYLDIMPVADAEHSVLPADVVAAYATETLSGMHQASIRMNGQTLPENVRVLRIMYIVHQQPAEQGLTLAASASTELLRTATEGDGGMQTFSIYNGLQQTLVQGADMTRARTRLRQAFKSELQERIRSALAEPLPAD